MRKQSEQTKIKIKLANKGYRWYNDGSVEVKSKEKPEGFSAGRLKSGKRWYTNGRETVFVLEDPGDGWWIGRSKLKKDRKWYNDGKRNFLLESIPFEKIKARQIFYGMIKGVPKHPKPFVLPQYATKPVVKKETTKKVYKEPEIKMGPITKLEKPLTSNVQEVKPLEVKKTGDFEEYTMEEVKEVVKKQDGKLTISQLRDICNNMEFENKYAGMLSGWGSQN